MPTEYGIFYKFIRGILRLSSKKATIQDFRKNKEGPVVYVSHHQNMVGPISVLKWYPEFVRTWIFSVFMAYETSYHQYVDYTLTERFGWPRSIAKIVAIPLAWFASTLTRSGRGIPVYRQSRDVLQTMNESVEALENGSSILIFPDVDYSDDSQEMKEIYDGFLYIEKYYYRKTKQHVPFVPIVALNESNEIRVGEPIYFTGRLSFFKEKKVVAEEIQHALNTLPKDVITQHVTKTI